MAADDLSPQPEINRPVLPNMGGPQGTDYRSVQAPAQVMEPWRLPQNGQADAAHELSQTFMQFSKQAKDVSDTAFTKLGDQQGSAAGASGNPNYVTGLGALTPYAQAYNNSATRSYAIQAEATAEDTASTLQVQANNNPTTFAATYGAARDATVKAAPPQAQAVITDMYNKRMASGLAALSHGQATEIQQSQRVDLSEGIARQTALVAQLQAKGDPGSMQQADEENVKLHMLINSGQNDGTLSTTEAVAARQDSMRQITSQTVQAQFNTVLRDPQGDPVKFIQGLQDANLKNPTLPPEEEAKLVDSLFTAMHQNNILTATDKREGKSAEQLRYEQGDQAYTTALLKGQLTSQQLAQAVQSQQLKPERATALMDQLKSGDVMKSDPHTLYDMKTDPNFLSMPVSQITAKPNISWADKADLVQEQQKRNASWEGTQNSKEARARIDRALGIVPGTITAALTDDEKRQRQTANTLWYDQMSKLDPAQRDGSAIPTAQGVIRQVIVQKQVNDLSKAQADLANFQQQFGDSAHIHGGIAKDEYDKRIANYERFITRAQNAAKTSVGGSQ
jgi:hypothetical protein